MVDLFRDFFRQIARDRLRTSLTLLGIVLGSAALCFLGSALTAGMEALTRTSQRISGKDVQRIRPSAPSFEQQWRTSRRLSEQDARALGDHEGLPDERIGTSYRLFGQDASVGKKRMKVGVQSGGTRHARLSNLALRHGRFLTPEEEARGACLIGFDVWQQLFGGRWPLAEPRLLLNDAVTLRVIGVFERRPIIGASGGDGTWMYDRKIYVGNSCYERRIQGDEGSLELAMRYDAASSRLPDQKTTALRLKPYLGNLHLGVYNFEFDALSTGEGEGSEDLILLGLGVILFAAGIVSMIVGGVNVMNAQLVSLQERTKEFGIRRALGASARQLRAKVLFESALISALGGGLGVGLGLGAAYGLALALTPVFLYWPFLIVGWSVAAALGSSLAVGLLAGLTPAIRAGMILPSECLREE